MDFIHIRYRDSIFAALARVRERHQRFQRLLTDRPAGIRVETRVKNPQVDLKTSYRRRFVQSSLASVLFCLALLLYPRHDRTLSLTTVPTPVIRIQNIPETSQRMRPPPPPRPSVPLAVEGEEVPEDITIESTELDLDSVLPDLRITGPATLGPLSEEPLNIDEIGITPRPSKITMPNVELVKKYKLKKETKVTLRVLVNKKGVVVNVEVLSGPAILHKEAMKIAYLGRYFPIKYKGRKREFWTKVDIDFKPDSN